MGKLKQHFMEQIDANYEFNCLHNPRFNVEPEEDYEGEIGDWVKRLSENVQILNHNRDLDTKNRTLELILQQLNYIRFLARNHRRRISAIGGSEEEEPDEEPEENPDQEHADAYYADQI